MDSRSEFDCLIDPAQVLDLGSPIIGVLDQVLVSRGDTVKKGQLVAQVESSIEESDLKIASLMASSEATIKAREAQVNYARKQWERAIELQQKGAISSQSFDELKANYIIAVQDLEVANFERQRMSLAKEKAQAILAQRKIRSTINGVVQKVDRGPGEYVFQEASIMTVVQLDPLFIETFIPVDRYKDVKLGMMGSVSISEPEEKTVKAEVIVVDKVFDTTSGTIGVRLKLDNPEGLIPAGQRCQVQFQGADTIPTVTTISD
ncbi:efflux RND transporter periplasmic adaptor subunit [Aestuariicella hydrocarbonica]|uniref:Efflux RND transporter periplasmic adaptor subunit n=1 Tax=Pseudomaricurvus hydrocarbonicus TaxID=1470433 RepID=A0A9E5T2G1_9GAMM|nr:efflux RND transporter periplasmic adaptor subunit [Aestuariicella hydrocarbonica]NHO67801.1 efflux RND transporter periplasmic adaptor subunit [Aestuariicella hydrocarbonica]